ncbi:hypothetical protein EYF80_034025 [Liparis tanakae]|uniref:Uncharacterized protein n=1 Tax=Liparis tanakae TaxID=230148 RepID=A0A4Z2GQC7_9TELE|nr:hypothetical protein EYF80_034025 [Liparis tanakae]
MSAERRPSYATRGQKLKTMGERIHCCSSCINGLVSQDEQMNAFFKRHPEHVSLEPKPHLRAIGTGSTDIFYLRQLLEGQLEAASVVGGTLGRDVLHGVFQLPLVADVGLHQVGKARGVRGLVIELEGRGKEG